MKIKTLLSFIALFAMTVQTAMAMDVTLSGNETEGYYINMSGSQTLTLTDASIKTFKVHNPAGASSTRQLTIIAPEGYTLNLSGKIPEAEGDYLWYYCYLKVYDGTTTQTQLGNEKYGCWGYTDPFSLFSTGNSMTLRFVVEGKNNTDGKGFQNLTVQLLDATANTEYNINISEVTGGTFSSSHTKAKSGEFVTITTTPEEGYLPDGISVTTASGETVSYTSADGYNWYNTRAMKYTFQMPAEEVNVVPNFGRTYSVTLPEHTIMLSQSTYPDQNEKYITGTEFTFKVKYPYTISNVSDGTNTLTAIDGIYTASINNADLVISANEGRVSNVDLNTLENDIDLYEGYLNGEIFSDEQWEQEYEAFILQDGDIVTGTASEHIFKIADGATITLNNATFDNYSNIVCKGSATIILNGTNSVNYANTYYFTAAAIQIAGQGATLVFKGEGSLSVSGGIGATSTASIYVYYGIESIEASFGQEVIYKVGERTVTGDEIATYFNIDEEDGVYTITSKASYSLSLPESMEIVTDATIKLNGKYFEDAQITIKAKDGYSISNVKANNTELTADENGIYTITIGDVDVVVTANGQKSLTGNDITIANIVAQTYTGEALMPAVEITDGETTLTFNVDYTVSYSNNVNVGTATATINGIGNYVGSVDMTFSIGKATPAFVAPENQIINCSQTLANVTLPSGYTFVNESAALAIGANTVALNYNPDANNYNTVQGNFTITVGHDFAAATYVWSEDNATCTATRVCSRDASHVETETVNVATDTVAATYETTGSITHTATFTKEGFAVQTKVEVIPVLENQGGNNQGGNNEGGNESQGGNNEGGNENQGGENNNPATAVDDAVAEAVSIYTIDGNTIVVENATDEIRVYDSMGKLICRDATPCVRAELQVNTAGVYIVKVGNTTNRVMVNE